MIKKVKQNYNHQTKGFTLVETFVAITILLITVLGPMSLLSNALKDARYIRDEITATYLAQEGIELMIDQRNKGVEFTPEEYSCSLNYNIEEGYNCSNGENDQTTIFKREIKVESANQPHQWEITSTVNFEGAGFPRRTITSRSIIFVNPSN